MKKRTGRIRHYENVIWAYNRRSERAAKAGITEDFTPYQRDRVMLQFGKRCFRCKSRKSLQIDHHLPLSYGHALDYGNAVVLCQKCNGAKSNLAPEQFYESTQLERLEDMLDAQLTWTMR